MAPAILVFKARFDVRPSTIKRTELLLKVISFMRIEFSSRPVLLDMNVRIGLDCTLLRADY